MKTTTLTMLLLAFASIAAFAADSKQDKDAAACNKAADAKVAKAKLNHPLDAEKIRRAEYDACMAASIHPGGKVRAK